MAIAGIGTVAEVWTEKAVFASHFGFIDDVWDGSVLNRLNRVAWDSILGLGIVLIESGVFYKISFGKGSESPVTFSGDDIVNLMSAESGTTLVSDTSKSKEIFRYVDSSNQTHIFYIGRSDDNRLLVGTNIPTSDPYTSIKVIVPRDGWVEMGEVDFIEGPGFSKTQIDVTTMGTTGGYREFISGLKDGGEVVLTMNFTKESYEQSKSIFDRVGRFGVEDYSFILDDNPSEANRSCLWFKASVEGMPVTVPIDDKVSMTVTLKVSGIVMFGTVGGTFDFPSFNTYPPVLGKYSGLKPNYYIT